MAKNKVNKTQAVREFLEANPEAGPSEIVKAMAKQRIKLTPSHAANIKSKLLRPPATVSEKQATPAAEPVPPAEAPVKPANAVTLEQIKLVGQMVKAIGGFRRLQEMLGVIKEVGGLKKFKDLLDAMAVAEKEEGIPF